MRNDTKEGTGNGLESGEWESESGDPGTGPRGPRVAESGDTIFTS